MQQIHSSFIKRELRRILSIAIPCLLSWVFTYLATNVFFDYAFGLFIWLPAVMGITSAMIYGYKNPTSKNKLRGISLIALLIFCLGLLTFAWEGIICMVMAAPIAIPLTLIGCEIGYQIIKNRTTKEVPFVIVLMYISVPSLMAFENSVHQKDDLRSVITSIEIKASPETVWKNVVQFPQLKQPTEFIFKTGIAYPINATIKGKGVGAIRHCNFSTGSFVEPITVWDEPNLLKFSVTEQPEPMKEISFYDIHPNHLHGYWVSKQGQFKLTRLSNGNTLLEGTTWYINKIKPGFYWTLWSDYIVHKIHNRVLEHIKIQSELDLIIK